MLKGKMVGGWKPEVRANAAQAVGSVRKALLHNRVMRMLAARKWTLLLSVIGILLGRAMILEQLSPFAIAYFAVIAFVKRDALQAVGIALLAGSLFSAHGQTAAIAAGMLIFWLIHQAMEKTNKSGDMSYVPLAVLVSSLLARVLMLVMTNSLGWFELMMGAVEASLSFILTMIFLQAVPVFLMSRKPTQLRHEEIICLMIMLASMMTGTVGWMLQGISVEHVMSRYLILLFALVGGAPLGASVGVITGLILSLASMSAIYQMSLLAFSGLLAGLLRDGKKPAVAIGMLIGSGILSMYIGDQPAILASIGESLVAIVLFLLTPRSLLRAIARYVPGTAEHAKTQHDYAKRVREVTANRVTQFSEVFRQLSSSFAAMPVSSEEERKEEEIGHFMNAVADKSCATCWKRTQCWDQKFYQTYKYMTDMMTEIEANPRMGKKDIRGEWERACVKTEQVMETMKQQYDLYKHDQHWKKQIQESRKLVADQLHGVSRVMEDLANEIKREGQELLLQEEQIRQALEELGLSIIHIDVICLDEGNVEIEMVHRYNKGFDECRKIIAPLLSDILGENIAVKQETLNRQGDGTSVVTFGSAKEYEVETGVAGAAKGGDLLSGDSFTTVELGNGKFAVAISDGMGNGERANAESRTALTILQQLLQSGMDEKLAVKSVNSVLHLRSSDEIFATIDVALIDQYTARTTFLKIGSTPSFIKRGQEVIVISANNLPAGILQEIDFDLVSVQLQPGDTLIMMTDGIYDAPGPAANKELWLRRIIQEIEAEDPQEVADCLLETVVRYHEGDIYDDMTVVVARIGKYQPEWAAFPWPGLSQFERPKTVS
ncbi:stage II sporulation protein E [Xylanibacillus composti]|uniref:Stage II sporulation protein E n=1 Tax=Xylanibacillus composti TaxID=1572762 RepID=A0A8J4H273_9BACL|nr:stage II sporulation protein E [Xylanibacillus composti]MDT9725134.1 stage II sporulation protein E [Xylanibacillus composti]GIQ67293.1 stage II sporulation protein E [Xylanibacillus composti]